ncbi:MAG: zinc ribbon domain-containing protein [Muribaculaceae bacterium]|nr:zinc ribbon domain-containing protein [Muribaculaceae bacterium]
MSHYCINCGNELSDHQYVCLKCHHNVYLDSIDDKMINASASFLTATQIEANTQWTKYRCGRDGNTGHGYAAEDLNSLNDRLSFSKVQNEGRNNKKDGADRISNGVHIQTKYCATPQKSINAAFENNGSGTYRYQTENGPQVLEVPSDQYETCLKLMEDKILNGQVEGVSDASKAKDIVRKGDCTYQQAKNLTKAGNIDSLVFDAKTGAVIALSSMGVSFCIKLFLSASSCRNIEDFRDAIQVAFIEGLKNGTITMSTTIFSLQVLRTQFGRNFAAAVQLISKDSINSLYSFSASRKLINDVASGLWQKTLSGASAKSVVVKLLRTNTITGVATFVVMSIPDTYRYVVSSSISGPQFIKNLVVNSASITGATVGGIIGYRFGMPGAMVGSMVGGAFTGILSKTVADKIHKDDSEYMQELIKIALLELSNEHSTYSEEEFNEAIRLIQIDKAIDTNLLRAMYAAGAEDNNDIVRVDIAKLALDYYFGVVDRQRKTLKILDKEELILKSINSINVERIG